MCLFNQKIKKFDLFIFHSEIVKFKFYSSEAKLEVKLRNSILPNPDFFINPVLTIPFLKYG